MISHLYLHVLHACVNVPFNVGVAQLSTMTSNFIWTPDMHACVHCVCLSCCTLPTTNIIIHLPSLAHSTDLPGHARSVESPLLPRVDETTSDERILLSEFGPCGGAVTFDLPSRLSFRPRPRMEMELELIIGRLDFLALHDSPRGSVR